MDARPEYNVLIMAGARTGDPQQAFVPYVYQLGVLLARMNIGATYGGGQTGLMGAFADGMLQENGYIEGVMPESLREYEIAHPGLNRFFWTANMHERKQIMHERANAYIALPGGFGTFEELLEAITWKQLGLHHKPIYLLDIDQYFAPFVNLVDNILHRQFASREDRQLFFVEESAAALLDTLIHQQEASRTDIVSTRRTIIQSAVDDEQEKRRTAR